MSKPNATLTESHFLWKAGTRVYVQACWNTRNHAIVTLPSTDGLPSKQSWILPMDCVELDEGVELEIEIDEPWKDLK